MNLTARLLTAIVSLALPLSLLAQTADMPKPESFNRSDRWEWRQVDSRTKLEEAPRIRTVVSADGVLQFEQGTQRCQTSEAFVGNPAKKPWRVWPIEVGKTWAYEEDWVGPDGVRGNTRQYVAVVAYEEVSVPAGKFMAFKIEHAGFYTNAAGGRGRQVDTFWYASDVSADIKHVRNDGYNSFTRELVVYKKAAP